MGRGETRNVLWIIALGTNRSPPRTATVVGLATAATSIDKARSRAAPKTIMTFRIWSSCEPHPRSSRLIRDSALRAVDPGPGADWSCRRGGEAEHTLTGGSSGSSQLDY